MTTPAPKNSLSIPPVEVTYEDAESGEVRAIAVQVTIKDRSAYEIYAHKHGWPTDRPMLTAVFLWTGFQAWSALRREPNAPEQLKTRTPDEFFDVILDVMPVVDEEEADTVSPFLAAPGHEPV